MTKPDESAGLPFLAIRSALSTLRQHAVEKGQDEMDPVAVLSNKGAVTPAEASHLVSAMVAAGFLVSPDQRNSDKLRLTESGLLYASERQRRVTPERRDALLQAVLARVREIASDPGFAFEVTALALFGSALRDDLPGYGDVDIALSIDFKRAYPDRWAAIEVEEKVTGIPVWDLDQGHPHLRIMRHLRQRSHAVHFDNLEDILRLHIPHRLLYTRPDAEMPGVRG